MTRCIAARKSKEIERRSESNKMEENEQLAKARQGKVGRWEGDSDQALYALDEQGHGFTWEQALRVLRTHKWLLGGVIAGLTMSV